MFERTPVSIWKYQISFGANTCKNIVILQLCYINLSERVSLIQNIFEHFQITFADVWNDIALGTYIKPSSIWATAEPASLLLASFAITWYKLI